MLAGATTAASTISTDTSPAISPPAARPPRRRGLSYLRNYTFGLESPHSSTPSDDQVHSRVRRSTTTADLAVSSAARRSDLDPSQDQPFGSEGDMVIQRPPSGTRRSMSRNRQELRLDGAGVSNGNEYSSRVAPLPVVPQNADTRNGAHQALMARTDGVNNMPAPSIDFIPAVDSHRSQRPSLDFKRIKRVLLHPDSTIKVGRYSERDTTHEMASSEPSDAPIGFKSKVVSRKHCEFSFQNGQWYLKDVKSSSGTFLNHIRLSQPGVESRPFPVNDGDIVQLGIDFKGGEEMIFRCVKIRVETNRGWQRGLNKFNKTTHKQLRQLAKAKADPDSDAVSKHSTECTICLNSIAPCQALFVAPCSHTWHYKCIRTILESTKYPAFLCPNCRAQADLDAEVEEEDLEDFDDFDEAELDEPARTVIGLDGGPFNQPQAASTAADLQTMAGVTPTHQPEQDAQDAPDVTSPTSDAELDTPAIFTHSDLAWALNSLSLRPNGDNLASLDDTIAGFSSVSPRPHTTADMRSTSTESHSPNGVSLNAPTSAFPSVPSTSSEPILVPSPRIGLGSGLSNIARRPATRRRSTLAAEIDDYMPTPEVDETQMDDSRIASAERLNREGPMTPRNAAGPFVFDGAGRTGSSPQRRSSERDRRATLRDSTMVGTDTEAQ